MLMMVVVMLLLLLMMMNNTSSAEHFNRSAPQLFHVRLVVYQTDASQLVKALTDLVLQQQTIIDDSITTD